MVDRRVAGRPLEHIIGWAEFYGLRIAVTDGVFVPRRRTEFLVSQAVALAGRPAKPSLLAGSVKVVVDLCCGSGAVGAAIAAELRLIDLHAVDIDPAAVRCALRNIAPAGGQVYEGDLYTPLPDSLRGHVDILVANAPYVPTAAIGFMPPEARIHEPLVALDGGSDGLEIQRAVIASAPQWLARGGHLLVETSVDQGPRTAQIVAGSGLLARLAHDDELDGTVVIGSFS